MRGVNSTRLKIYAGYQKTYGGGIRAGGGAKRGGVGGGGGGGGGDDGAYDGDGGR